MANTLFNNAFFYGTQFYRPPNPPREQRERDLENIKKLGFNVIKIFAEWNWINHREGVYDFDELLEIIEHAKKLDITIVVNTRLEQVPYWLPEKHPDSLYVNARGRKIPIQTRANTPTGGWPGVCFDHPGARKEAEDFFERIATVLGEHENVRIFDCWNEPHIEPMEHSDSSGIGDFLFCYCHNTIKAYRAWLKSRYENIEEINSRWYRRYRDFDDIDPPPRLMDYVDMTEWRQFMTWSMADKMSWRYKSLKTHLPAGKKIMSHTVSHGATNGFGLFGCDDYQFSKDLDMFGLSLFPLWGNQDAYEVLRELGVTRSMGRDKICINLELQGGASASSPTGLTRSKTPKRNHYRTWNFCDVAAGMRGIMYWHYREEMLGREAPGFGLVKRDGSFTERSDETSQLCKFFNKHAVLFNNHTVYNDTAAIIVLRDSYYLNFASEGEEVFSVLAVRGMHRFLLRYGIEADFLIEEMLEERLNNYKMAYLPLPLVMDDRIALILKRYVEQGGILLSDSCVGSFNKYGTASEVVPSSGLNSVFGAIRDEIRQFDFKNREEIYSEFFTLIKDEESEKERPAIYFNGLNSLDLQRIRMSTFLETYTLKGATPLLQFEDNITGVVNSVGRGKAYLFGTVVGQSLALKDMDTGNALLSILKKEGIDYSYNKELIIRELRYEDRVALIIINPLPQTVNHAISFPEPINIIDCYDPLFHYTSSGNELHFNIGPEDANCFIYTTSSKESTQ